MTTADRRLRGRDVRRLRHHGWTKQQTLAEHARIDQAWTRIRETAAPAIRSLLAYIANEQPTQQLIHNGRKPR